MITTAYPQSWTRLWTLDLDFPPPPPPKKKYSKKKFFQNHPLHHLLKFCRKRRRNDVLTSMRDIDKSKKDSSPTTNIQFPNLLLKKKETRNYVVFIHGSGTKTS